VIQKTDVRQDGAQAVVRMRQIVLHGESAFEFGNCFKVLEIFRRPP
jgi:hypothetical protein